MVASTPSVATAGLHPLYGAGMRWPNGSEVAVALGWDDGTVADRRLVAALNAYGLPATFFLNSGKLGMSAARSGWKEYVAVEEVAALYAGHEVASHTVDHPDLTALPDAQIAEQVDRDRAALAALVGYPVTGFAAPFRAQDARVEAVLRRMGIAYSRGSGADPAGRPPDDPLRWVPAAHCLQDVPSLLAGAAPGSLLCIWGHSYEYDEQDAWHRLDAMLEALAAHDCWVATHRDAIAALAQR
jgi:peptidoglycan/xylan/chitin deacetylase (PgdA/CDA1 family)